MTLYLIRHAHAVDAEENPARPLSAKGRAQVASLVEQFRTDGRLRPAETWHSPLVRSRETAALLVTGLAWKSPPALTPGFEPEDDPAALVPRIDRITHDLAIVGHEPHLGLLLLELVRQPTDFVFRKASVLALARRGTTWDVLWHSDAKR